MNTRGWMLAPAFLFCVEVIAHGRDEPEKRTKGVTGMKEYAERFYKSKAWQRCREGYAKSRGRLCERCLKRGIYKPGVIVHHRVHLTPENITDPAVALDWGNLELLCRDCHGEAHEKHRRRYRIDALGRVTPRD